MNANSAENAQGEADLFAQQYKKEIFDVDELEKTEEELEAIKMAQSAFDEFADDLDLPKMQFNENEIHVLSEEEYRQKISSKDEQKEAGKHSFGHIYCIRTCFNKFLHYLAHELAHKYSFYHLGVDSFVDSGNVAMKQSGLSFTKNNDKHLFNGLNEAVTELTAKEILEIIIDKNKLLEKEREDLVGWVSYFPQVEVLNGLIREISGNDFERHSELMKDIFRANFTGDYGFLKEFEKYRKGTIKILRQMGDTNDSALEAAKKLELTSVVLNIEDIIKSGKDL